jgi:hypothetical protein
VTRVSIFMSVFDVHINRAPVGGTVKRVFYIPGKFMNADLDKASDENERQHVLIERSRRTTDRPAPRSPASSRGGSCRSSSRATSSRQGSGSA